MSYLKSAPSNLSICKILQKKTKTSKLGIKNASFAYFFTKNALSGYLWATIFKDYCYIWNQHPQICLFAKFRKFGTTNILFAYFWARILEDYCRIWNMYPWICRLEKFCEKQKCLNLGSKMLYLGILGLEF